MSRRSEGFSIDSQQVWFMHLPLFRGLTGGFRYQNRGRGTPELSARCDRWNAQLPYLVFCYHLGRAKLRTGGSGPRLVLHQDRAALHSSFKGSQTTGIDIQVSRLLRVR